MRVPSVDEQFAIEEGRYRFFVTITFPDTTTMRIDEDKIWDDGFEIDRSVSGQNTFELGACVVGQFKLTLNNVYGDFDNVAFYGAVAEPCVEFYGIPDWKIYGTWSFGLFNVDEIDSNNTFVKLTCLDNMTKFDIPYSKAEALLGSPIYYTPLELVQACCSAAGVPCGVNSSAWYRSPWMDYITSGYHVGYRPPEVKATTCRDAISMACTVSGNYAYIDNSGQLKIAHLNDSWLAATSINPEYYANHYPNEYHFFNAENLTKLNRAENNIRITGVTMTDLDLKNSNIEEYSEGVAGYVIEYPMNQIVNPQLVTAQNWVKSLYKAYRYANFRPFKATHLSDMTIEAGDNVLIQDEFGGVYKSVILHTVFKARGLQESECAVEPGVITNATRYTESAKAVAKLSASLIPYDDGNTSLGATNTQAAIEAIHAENTAMNSDFASENGVGASIATATWTDAQTLAVTKGVWLVSYGVRFAQNATGYRQIALTNSATAPSIDRTMPTVPAVNGELTAVVTSILYEASAAETLHVWAYQNSGSTLVAYPFIRAIKLK